MSANTIAERVAEYNQAAVKVAEKIYDAAGRWRWPQLPAAPRERFWLCLSLFPAGATALANAIIEQTEIKPRQLSDYVTGTFDIFHTNTAVTLLHRHGGLLTPAARAKLEALALEGLGTVGGNHTPDLQFHGYNDNMPSEASMGLILGGELFGNEAAVGYGLWNLRRLRDMLYRRGTVSEFNSPTYSALTLLGMAEIADGARHPECRDIAAKIEERLWLDLAGRFHPEMGLVSGPYSRAYTVNELGHVGCLSAVLWFVLGDLAQPSVMALFDERRHGFMMNDWAFFIAQMALFSADIYHPSKTALRLFRKKRYPARAVATVEMGDGGVEQPARPARIETWLTNDYTLGTISSYAGGQGQPYFVTYKRRRRVESQRDYGTIYQKFVLNDSAPGVPMPSYGPNGEPYSESGEVYIGSYANTLTLQDGPTALVITNPQYQQAGGHQSPKLVSRLSNLILCPQLEGGAADEVIVSGEPRPRWGGAVRHGAWIGARRGKLLVAYRMLAFADATLPVRTSLEKINYHEAIRTEFYHGEPREFTPEELRKMFCGFVAEHASVSEYPSLAAFLEDLSAAKFTDYYWIMRRTRYRRPATASRKALELEISSTPGGTVSRYATINGRPVPQDKPVEISGLKARDYPILSEPWQSIPDHFPWPKLDMIWGKGIVSDPERG